METLLFISQVWASIFCIMMMLAIVGAIEIEGNALIVLTIFSAIFTLPISLVLSIFN